MTEPSEAEAILERIDRAERMAPVGSPSHDHFIKAALLSEWPRIKLILTAAAQVREGRGGKIIQGLREAVAGDLAIVTIEGQVWERRPGSARHTPDLMPTYGATEPDSGPSVLGMRKGEEP